MTATLAKGGNLFLRDEAPGIEQVRIGLGWRNDAGAAAVEIDGIVSLVEDGPAGRLLLSHQVPNPEESVSARPEAGQRVGDAERLVVTLADVPSSVTRLAFGAAIYDAAHRRQTFRSVREAYIRVLNHANGVEIARYTLEVETGSETAMVFGELYRNPKGWKFRAVGQGYANGLRGIVGTGEPRVARPVEVTDYLRRISPARTRRSFTEHLSPPAPTAPAPPKPQPHSQPQPKPQPPSPARPTAAPSPSRPSMTHPARHAAPPATPPASPPPVTRPPAARPSTPHPPASHPPAARPPAARPPAARPPAQPRSALDLSGPEEQPSTGGSSTGSANGKAARGGEVEYGEHSSRYRQRQEHVSVLDDQHRATTWTEADRGSGGMTIVLRWESLKTSSGLPRPSDLHLGAFWQAADRSEGIMQTLGNTISAPGAAGPRQVLRLGRRDEREGQTIFVDLATLPTFRRFFVFVYGQHGSPEWERLRPEVVLAAPSGESLSMRLGEAPPGARLCVVASFHMVGGDLIVRRENDYVDGVQAAAGERYGWLLDWNSDGMTLRKTGS